jgi:hypothetical protein
MSDDESDGLEVLLGYKRKREVLTENEKVRSETNAGSSDKSAGSHASEDDIKTAQRGIESLAQNISIYKTKEMRELRTAAFPFFGRQGVKGAFQGSVEQTDSLSSVNDVDVATILRVLMYFEELLNDGGKEGIAAFRSNKPLRRSLYYLSVALQEKKPDSGDMSLENKISDAFGKKRWDEAHRLLLRLATSTACDDRRRLKLGTMQRWVREADVLSRCRAEVGESESGSGLSEVDVTQLANTSWLLLDLVLRVMDSKDSSNNKHKLKSSCSIDLVNLEMHAEVRRRDPFDIQSLSSQGNKGLATADTNPGPGTERCWKTLRSRARCFWP